MIKDKLKVDDAIIKQLDLKRISRLICNTDKGILELTIRKGETSYFLTLDSVPLSKEDNKTLMDLLFPVPKMEVPQVNKEPIELPKKAGMKAEQIIKCGCGDSSILGIDHRVGKPCIVDTGPTGPESNNLLKKKLGRPKGSVNKPKNPETNGSVN